MKTDEEKHLSVCQRCVQPQQGRGFNPLFRSNSNTFTVGGWWLCAGEVLLGQTTNHSQQYTILVQLFLSVNPFRHFYWHSRSQEQSFHLTVSQSLSKHLKCHKRLVGSESTRLRKAHFGQKMATQVSLHTAVINSRRRRSFEPVVWFYMIVYSYVAAPEFNMSLKIFLQELFKNNNRNILRPFLKISLNVNS